MLRRIRRRIDDNQRRFRRRTLLIRVRSSDSTPEHLLPVRVLVTLRVEPHRIPEILFALIRLANHLNDQVMKEVLFAEASDLDP